MKISLTIYIPTCISYTVSYFFNKLFSLRFSCSSLTVLRVRNVTFFAPLRLACLFTHKLYYYKLLVTAIVFFIGK